MLRPWPATLHALSGETFCRKAIVPYDGTAGRPALSDTVHLSGADGSEYLGSILAVHSTNDQETIVIVPPPPWEPCMETTRRRAEARAIDDLALADLRAALHVKTGKPPSAFSPILLITRTLPGEDVPHAFLTIAYSAGQPLHDVLALYARQSGYSLTLRPGDRLDFTTYPHLPLP